MPTNALEEIAKVSEPVNECANITTVYYDGSCPLCRAEIAHYRSCRGAEAVDFVDVSGPDAAPGSDLTRREAMARLHVRLPDGRLVSGAEGFLAVWRALPGWRWLARIGSLPLVLPVLEIGYRMFLPVRPLLSRVFRGASERMRS